MNPLLRNADPVAVCPGCGRVVLRWVFADGSVFWEDPGHADRRMVWAFMGPDWVGRFGYSPACGGPPRVHVCPGPPPIGFAELVFLLAPTFTGPVGWDGASC